jgi:EAL domain-containing protein (putative c-di-GMP-specific phosphodiesterase class I)
VAEEARLIGPIGEWVLRTACREAMRWPAHIERFPLIPVHIRTI